MSTNIDKCTSAQNMTIGGNIYTAGNAVDFKTGDWRSIKPKYICKGCGVCANVCPFKAIEMVDEG